MKDLVIMKNGVSLEESGADSVISVLTEKDAHFVGTVGIGKVKSTCKKKKGYNMGEGVCLLYRFIEQREECSRCTERTPLEQLNWLFQSVPRLEEFSATWGNGKNKTNFQVETEHSGVRLCDCIEYLEEDHNDLEEVL